MTVPFRTFAAFGLAFGMIGLGYQFAPGPGATPLPQPVAKAAAAEPSKAEPSKPEPARPVSTLVASRPPVPLVTPPRPAIEQASAPSDKPTVNMGTVSGNPSDPNDKTQALAVAPPAMTGDGSQAKRAIEFDGYRNVRGLEKGPDGAWHGRAMRGRTEIAVRVDASGNVSAE